MAKKKKKKQSAIWGAVKWVAAIGGGAVVGAYTVRFVDRRLAARGIQTGLAPSQDEGPATGGAIGAGEAYAAESVSPMSNPLAVQAISPVIPIPVGVPQMFPQLTAPPVPPMPQLPPMHPMSSRHGGDDLVDEPLPAKNPIETAAEARARKAAEFDELVRRFEDGEFD